MFVNILKELTTLGHFHNNKDISRGIQHFIEFDDVGVFDKFEYFYLSFDLLRVGGTLEIIFLFFIRDLFIILTATRWPVNVCRPSKLYNNYHAL